MIAAMAFMIAATTNTVCQLPPLDSTGLDTLLASLGDGQMASISAGGHRASRAPVDDATWNGELRALLD